MSLKKKTFFRYLEQQNWNFLLAWFTITFLELSRFCHGRWRSLLAGILHFNLMIFSEQYDSFWTKYRFQFAMNSEAKLLVTTILRSFFISFQSLFAFRKTTPGDFHLDIWSTPSNHGRPLLISCWFLSKWSNVSPHSNVLKTYYGSHLICVWVTRSEKYSVLCELPDMMICEFRNIWATRYVSSKTCELRDMWATWLLGLNWRPRRHPGHGTGAASYSAPYFRYHRRHRFTLASKASSYSSSYFRCHHQHRQI